MNCCRTRPIPPGSAGDQRIFGSEDEARSSNEIEAIVYEYEVNFDDVPSAGGINARLSAILNSGAVPGTGTYRLYIGAFAPGDTNGGTVRATITTQSPVDESGPTTSNLGFAFVKPLGRELVQITAQHSVAGGAANMRGMTFSIGTP